MVSDSFPCLGRSSYTLPLPMPVCCTNKARYEAVQYDHLDNLPNSILLQFDVGCKSAVRDISSDSTSKDIKPRNLVARRSKNPSEQLQTLDEADCSARASETEDSRPLFSLSS